MTSATVGIDVRRATWAPQLGISRYARSLLTAMVGLARPELRLTTIDLKGSPHWPGLGSKAVGSGHGFAERFAQEQLRMAAHSRSLDLLHLPWYEGPALVGCPLVVNVHDLDTLEYPEGYRWRFRAYYNTLLHLYLRRAQKIIVPSEFTLGELEARWPGRPYVCIPYAVDAIFRTDGAVERPVGDGRSLIYAGGFGHRKRLGDLLDAFAEVARANGSVSLVVAGAAPEDFTRGIERRGLTNRVRLVGFVEDTVLARLYREADLVLYPSMLEGFGFPVLEAMASGTPVVATTGGSVPEIAGSAALLVEPRRPDRLAEAILSLLADEGARQRLRAAGLRRAAEFNWNLTAERTLSVYREVLEASKSD